MDYAEQQRNPGKHVVGLGVVVALHLALGWALVNGLAQRLVEVIKAPIETKIVEEIKPPPPPPENLPPPKFVPPPPSFVPPPEVNVNAPAALGPSITTTTVAPPPAPVLVAPPPPPVAVAPPAPPVRTEPKIDFASACQRPEYTRAARQAEAQGTVVIVYTMDTTGTISDAHVEKSAGPSREQRMLDRQTLEAVLACKGKPGTVDGKPVTSTSRVTYVWKITD